MPENRIHHPFYFLDSDRGQRSVNGPFSIALLVYWRVIISFPINIVMLIFASSCSEKAMQLFLFLPWPEEYQPFKVWQRRHRTVQRGDGCPFHRRRREDFGIHQRSLEKLVISLPCFSIFSQICWSVTSSECRLHTHIYIYMNNYIYMYTCNYCTYSS